MQYEYAATDRRRQTLTPLLSKRLAMVKKGLSTCSREHCNAPAVLIHDAESFCAAHATDNRQNRDSTRQRELMGRMHSGRR